MRLGGLDLLGGVLGGARRLSNGGSRILTSEDLAAALRGGAESSAGIDVTTESAMRLATVFGCVRVLAESVGQLPLHLLEQPDPDGRQKNKARKHPLFGLMKDAPNGWQTSQEWREFGTASQCLTGNTYSQIIRTGRSTAAEKISELQPLNPGSVTPKRTGNSVVYEIALDDGRTETLPMREVFHVPLFSLAAEPIGLSPISYARNAIGLGLAAETHGAGFYRNGARPSGVLEVAGELSPEAYERLLATWSQRHEGAANAGKTALLEGGTKYSAIGVSAADAQFIETRKFQRAEICAIFRVPPHMVADLEKATFSNIEQQALEFVVHSLMPYLTRFESRANFQLLTPEERETHFFKFNLGGLLRGDMAARGEFYSKLFNAGVLSSNDIRDSEDMNPREGGDVYLTPTNLYSDAQREAAGSEPAPSPGASLVAPGSPPMPRRP